jgi:hypothetical protein
MWWLSPKLCGRPHSLPPFNLRLYKRPSRNFPFYFISFLWLLSHGAGHRKHCGARLQKTSRFQRIRLLHLQPGCANDPIVCQMVYSNFLDKIQYKSLLYMWEVKSLHYKLKSTELFLMSGTISIKR